MTENNAPLVLAREIIETTDRNLFLTGKAGTGKTTFLRRLRQDLPKRMVVLAPTGIAAINAEGVTIHSFFQLPFTLFLPDIVSRDNSRYGMTKQKQKLIQSLDLLVIDEISMVRCDLLDAVDSKLRKIRRINKPFGGVQTLLIGDLHQLSPVIRDDDWELMKKYYETPFFFSAKAFKEADYISIELEHVYRQSDTSFLQMLNELREGRAGQDLLDKLNSRYIPDYRVKDGDDCIQLVTHNWQAQRINDSHLELLPAEAFTYSATIDGKFPEISFPTEETLVIKVGAQVMFVKNDKDKRYCNGTIASVVGADNKGFKVRLSDSDRTIINVEPEEWANARYALDEESGEIKEVIDGTFTQFPVKLAWAITIHKSQGLTFDHVMIDASKAFAHGQTYVALSRCKTLEGIVLTSPLSPSSVIIDRNVQNFDSNVRSAVVNKENVEAMRKIYCVHLLEELFSFDNERIYLAQIKRLFEEYLNRLYPKTAELFEIGLRNYDFNVISVSQKFHTQYVQILQQNGGVFEDNLLQERLRKGGQYFSVQLENVRKLVEGNNVQIDNKEVSKRMKSAKVNLLESLDAHIDLLEWVTESGFSQKKYLNERAKVIMKDILVANKKKVVSKSGQAKKATVTQPSEVKNTQLFAALQAWRRKKAEELAVPAYVVLQTKAMLGIADLQPLTEAELLRIPYFGKVSLDRFGKDLLQIIRRYARYDE